MSLISSKHNRVQQLRQSRYQLKGYKQQFISQTPASSRPQSCLFEEIQMAAPLINSAEVCTDPNLFIPKFNRSAGGKIVQFLLFTTTMALLVKPAVGAFEGDKNPTKLTGKNIQKKESLEGTRGVIVEARTMEELEKAFPTLVQSELYAKSIYNTFFEKSYEFGINHRNDEIQYIQDGAITPNKIQEIKKTKKELVMIIDKLKEEAPWLRLLLKSFKIRIAHQTDNIPSNQTLAAYRQMSEIIEIEGSPSSLRDSLKHELRHALWHQYHKSKHKNSLETHPFNFNQDAIQLMISILGAGKHRIANYINIHLKLKYNPKDLTLSEKTMLNDLQAIEKKLTENYKSGIPRDFAKYLAVNSAMFPPNGNKENANKLINLHLKSNFSEYYHSLMDLSCKDTTSILQDVVNKVFGVSTTCSPALNYLSLLMRNYFDLPIIGKLSLIHDTWIHESMTRVIAQRQAISKGKSCSEDEKLLFTAEYDAYMHQIFTYDVVKKVFSEWEEYHSTLLNPTSLAKHDEL